MSETVSDALCRERQRVQDERFARDKERIEDLEKICEKLNRLSIEMGELIKKHDEESVSYTHLERGAEVFQPRGKSGRPVSGGVHRTDEGNRQL